MSQGGNWILSYYFKLYQDRVPNCNCMGEENEVNLGKVVLEGLREIQRGDVLKAFIFPDL